MKLAILLTATVKVQVVGGNFNMEERAAMYASTLRYYADHINHFLKQVYYQLSQIVVDIINAHDKTKGYSVKMKGQEILAKKEAEQNKKIKKTLNKIEDKG